MNGSKPGARALFARPLPVAETRAPGQSAAEDAPPLAPLNGKRSHKTILLAEDQPAIQLLITTFLKQSGFHVLAAANGSEALQLAQGYAGEIDLLLTDVMMPGMDGPALALALRALRPQMKTLLMSGDPERLLPEAGDREPGVLRKPFGLPKLLDKVQEMTTHTSSQ